MLTSLMGLHFEWVMQQLYFHAYSFSQFCEVLEKESGVSCSEESLQFILQEQQERSQLMVKPILTDVQRQHWEQYGYLKLPGILSDAQCADARKAIWDFLDADEAVPDSWYKPHSGKKGLMLTLSHHRAFNVVRQSAYLHQVFCELYDSTSIFPLIDKCSFNPPETAAYRFAGSSLHWDTSLVQPIPLQIQGLVYLNATASGEGAFSCVPGFHHTMQQWLTSLSKDAKPRESLQHLKSVEINGQAGDFILWHQALPHAATPNRGKQPRLVQYFTYLPDKQTDFREWI